MGCDYYICNVLKIVHTNGITLLKLSEKPVYGSHYDGIHPVSKLPQYMSDFNPYEYDEELVYKKGEQIIQYALYIPEYMELIQELIKVYADDNYVSQNKIIQNNGFFSHDVNGEALKSIDDIHEIYMVELHD